MGGAWQWALHSFYQSPHFTDDVLVAYQLVTYLADRDREGEGALPGHIRFLPEEVRSRTDRQALARSVVSGGGRAFREAHGLMAVSP